jgi:uncharacterized protein YjiK
MANIKYVLIVFLLPALISEATAQPDFPYDLDNPVKKIYLPSILEEVSGQTLINDEIIIFIQDEEGDLFFYDLKEERLIKRVDFGKDADYEDVALVGDEVYVLRSNGLLFRLKNYEDENEIKTKEIETRLSKKNNCEGLAYDPVENRLLIALKGDPEVHDDQDFDGYKAIYAYDFEQEKVSKKPAYLIELKKIKDLENASLYEKWSHRIAETFEESGDIRFQPSAIAIHPLTDQIYILASVGKALVVMNRNGDLESIQQLDKWRFVQPEGIAFGADGTLYISSEGDGGNGMLMIFEMRK